MTARIRRLAGMEPRELRFRLACELRKTAGRVVASMSTPRWRRGNLRRVLRAERGGSPAWSSAIGALRAGDFDAAHVAMAAHFSGRPSPFPLNARELRALVRAIIVDFPEAPEEARQRGDALLNGAYDLLGHTGLQVGTPPDWHSDPVRGRRPPLVFWASVPYLDSAIGDHKVIWELNRHQHWLVLGRAHGLTGDGRYYEEFVNQLTDWLSANPPLVGTNWASMLELALRALSWLWALEMFAGAAGSADRQPWTLDLLLALDRQLAHIEQNLSRYFSPNTHLSGEALALYVAGLALPELRASARRAAVGRDVLVQEATRQILDDGGHAERSTHYHRYSTDFYLLAYAVARRAGDPACTVFEEAGRRQARYLRTMTDDAGVCPAIGDDDGGQLFPICGRRTADCRDTLATAAVLLGDPALAVGRAPEETYWMCGTRARNAGWTAPAPWPSTALAVSGYYVSRTARGDHFVFDAGPHGYLNGGHAHADALSCTLTVAGRPVLVDPGTATYTMNPELRDRFRGTKMHNTLVVNGRPQSVPQGAFHWKSRTSAQAPIWRISPDCDYFEGTHDAYAPLRHTRAILAIHGLGWWILDHIIGEARSAEPFVEAYWHLHPSWSCQATDAHTCRLSNGSTELALVTSGPVSVVPAGGTSEAFWSPVYGRVEPAPVVRTAWSMSVPASMATFIPAIREVAVDLQIEERALIAPPGPGWHGCAFRVRWSGGHMSLVAAVEQTGVATGASAPNGNWGSADLCTDARVAVLIGNTSRPPDVLLVNGTVARCGSAPPLMSLPEAVPLLRARAWRAPCMRSIETRCAPAT